MKLVTKIQEHLSEYNRLCAILSPYIVNQLITFTDKSRFGEKNITFTCDTLPTKQVILTLHTEGFTVVAKKERNNDYRDGNTSYEWKISLL